MASLAVLSPQTVNNLQERNGAAMVNKPESSALPAIVDRPERSSRSLGNDSANGNSEAENTPRDAVVFSFRDYILGTVSNAKAQDSAAEIQGNKNISDCSERKAEKETEKDTSQSTQLNNAGSFEETQRDCLLTEEREVEISVDLNKGCDKKEISDCEAVIKESARDGASSVCAIETVTNSNFNQGVLSCADLHSIDAKALLDIQKEGHSFVEKAQLSKKETQRNVSNNSEREATREGKTKGKKKKRRKKKTESKSDMKQEGLQTAPSDNNEQASLEHAGKNLDFVENIQSLKDSDIMSGFREPVFTPPLCSPATRPDHLTHSACSPVSGQHSLQMPDQTVDHNMSASLCGMDQCSAESLQKEQHAPVAIDTSASTVVTHVQCLKPSVPADNRPNVQRHEAVVTSGESSLSGEKQGPLSNSRICVGESGVEVALEEAFVAVAALPASTPTAPEVIASEESARCDSLEKVSTGAGGESGEADLRVSDKRLGRTDRQTGGRLHSLSLIPSQENCTLAFSDAAGRVVTEERCSDEMPHNSIESETKAPGETSICVAQTEPCTEEGARENEQLRPEAFTDASPCGALTGFYCDDQGSVGSERAAATQARGGREESKEEKGGGSLEQSPVGQLRGFLQGVSSAETEKCLPSNVAESPSESQRGSEPVPAIAQCLAAKRDRLSQPCQEQCAALAKAASPRLSSLEQSSANSKEGPVSALRSEVNSEEWPSLEGISEEGPAAGTEREDGQVILPPTASQKGTGSVQQVPSESSTAEGGTTDAASETQELTQATCRSSAISEVGVHVCKSGSRSNNKVRFADTVKQEGGTVVSLKEMAGQTLDCASMPPLTVHENLHYPVVEESYTFPKYLTKNTEDLNAATPATNESATQSLGDATLLRKHSQFDEDDEVNKRAEETVDPDKSSNITLGFDDLKVVKEASLNYSQGPIKEDQRDAHEKHVVLQSFGTVDHILEKGNEIERENDGVLDEVEDPLSEQHLVCLSAMDPANVDGGKQDSHQLRCHFPEVAHRDSNNVITEKRSEPFATEHLNVTASCTTPPLSKPTVPSFQPTTQMDMLPFTDVTEGTFDSSSLNKFESHSEAIALDQPAPVIEQYATNLTSVPFSPQPMSSHLELITDSDVSLPEQNDCNSAHSGSVEVQGQRGEEITLSFEKEIEQSDVSDEGDQNSPEEECVVDTSGSCYKDNIEGAFPQVAELSPVTVTPIMVTGVDDVISQTPTESDPNGIKRDISESATMKNLVNSTCPLSLVTAATLQQDNGSIECSIKEQDLQPTPQVEDTETPMKDLNEDYAVSPKRKTMPFNNFQSSKVEVDSVRQTGLQEKFNPAVECSTDREASQSAATRQSLPEADPNNFAWQQNQQQWCLSSSHPLEVSPGGCFQEGEGTKRQVRQTQEMINENKAVAEAGEHCIKGVWQTAGSDGLTCDDSSGKEQFMCHEKADGKETQARPEVQSTIVSTPKLDKSLLPDVGEEVSSSNVDDARQEMLIVSALGFKEDSKSLGDPEGKVEQQSDVLTVCQGQGEIPEALRNTGVSVNSESQQHEISLFEVTVISAANTDSCGIHERACSTPDQAQETHREISNLLPDPESVKSHSTAAEALEGSTTKSEKCEILHTPREVVELQSSDVATALQSNRGGTAAIKGLGAGEVFGEDKAALVKEQVSCQESGQNEIKAIKRERAEVVNPSGCPSDSSLDVIKVLDVFESGDSLHSPETVDCHFLPKVAKHSDAIAALPAVKSKYAQDLTSSCPMVPTRTERPCDQVHEAKEIAAETIDAGLEPQRTSLVNSSPCNSSPDSVKSSAEMCEASNMVKRPAPDAGSSWIKALKEAAVQSQSTQENTGDESR